MTVRGMIRRPRRADAGWSARVVWAGLLVLPAAPAPAALVNGAFDDDGGSLAGWSTFNNVIPNVYAAPLTPRSGTHVAEVFGAFTGDPNWSGLFQGLAASPGEVWTAACYSRHNDSDPMAGTNRIVMKIEFYRVFGGVHGTDDFLGESEITVLDGSSQPNVWTPYSFQLAAPAETVEARIAFVFIQEGYAGGAGLIDDVTFATDAEPPSGAAWRLLWHDEFDGTTVDPSKWRVEDLHLIKNDELQYYAPDDVYVQNGVLTLRSQERTYWGYDSDGQWGRYDYTSGLVESAGRFFHTYGRVEVRAKLPSTQGMWPAHWMLPADGGWPPEIDIMELLGHEPNKVYMTHHWGTWPNVQSHGGSFTGPDFSQDFHCFAIEWDPGRIDWFVDDLPRFVSTTNVPDEPFYIILNTAVGGDWPGDPDESTVFPQYHDIDYVRWYVRGDPADFDGDGEVDLEDYAVIADCLSGPGAAPAPTPPRDALECLTVFDFDDDGDIDLADLGTFQSAFPG
jgi:beta-glucanase (GH16 family)